jgi:hypothetical protein
MMLRLTRKELELPKQLNALLRSGRRRPEPEHAAGIVPGPCATGPPQTGTVNCCFFGSLGGQFSYLSDPSRAILSYPKHSTMQISYADIEFDHSAQP